MYLVMSCPRVSHVIHVMRVMSVHHTEDAGLCRGIMNLRLFRGDGFLPCHRLESLQSGYVRSMHPAVASPSCYVTGGE